MTEQKTIKDSAGQPDPLVTPPNLDTWNMAIWLGVVAAWLALVPLGAQGFKRAREWRRRRKLARPTEPLMLELTFVRNTDPRWADAASHPRVTYLGSLHDGPDD
jgi:hypothetical protein